MTKKDNYDNTKMGLFYFISCGLELSINGFGKFGFKLRK